MFCIFVRSELFRLLSYIFNLTIPAIVGVPSAYSRDCSPPFWQFLEFPLPEVLRSGGPQCQFHVLAVLEVLSAAEFFQTFKCIEIAPRHVRGIRWMEQLLHLEVLQLLLGEVRIMRSRAVHQEPCVPGGNSGLHRLQLLAEESWVDSFNFSDDLPAHWSFWAEEETQHLFLATHWPLRNELRILIGVTPFERVVGILVRDPPFILGDDKASPLSVGGAMKQLSAGVNSLLQLRRCEITRDSRPLGLLPLSCRARRTVYLEAPFSADHFLTPFLGFA